MVNKPTPLEIADQAKLNYQSGDYSGAAEGYANAADAFKETSDLLMSAEMRNNQSVALLRDKQAQAALDVALGTDEVFADIGDNRRQGMALANQAAALSALKRPKEAIELFTRAADSLNKAGEIELRLEVMQLLSALYLRRLKLYDSIITLQSGLIALKNPTPKQRFMKKLLFFRL